jgi:thiol-disulfide isomerase/thioredoxin
MIQKLKYYLKETILFLIVLTLFANALSYYKSADLNKDSLPVITAKLIDGSAYTTNTHKPRLIHIWATWCPTCKLEAGNIQRVSQKFDVVTIAVKSGSNEDIQNFLQENNLNYKVINDKDGFLANKFNISAYPTTFIYDKNGNLVFSEVGYTSSLGLFIRMWWIGF